MKKRIYLFSTSKHKDAININSLDVKFLTPKIDFKQYDNLIITSKQIIKALDKYDINSFINKPSICVSVKTSTYYEEFGGRVLDVGNGYGNDLVDIIKKYPKTTKWLYLRAETVASNFVQQTTKDGYNVSEKILYSTECSQELLNFRIYDDSTLIFTSPLCVKCFLKNNTIHPKAKVIAIGKTTANAFPNGIKYYISNETSIESCMDLALGTF